MAQDDRKVPAASSAEVQAFLAKVARAPLPAPGTRGRLLFAMDATASREPTWDRACAIQAQMFSETAALGGLDIQLASYGGIGEFRASRWVSRAEDLIALMRAVHCVGGPTQIGVVLRHALGETRRQRVNAVVFVGDSVEEPADDLRARAGELGLLGVPVFVFQEGFDAIAEPVLREIARLSGGAWCRFDSASAQQLRDLLSAVAVYAAGGRRALQDFSRRRGGDVKLLAGQVR